MFYLLLFIGSFAHSVALAQSEKVFERRPLILKSLTNLFYAGNPMPPKPKKPEIGRARVVVNAAPKEEREALMAKTVLGENYDLWALAIRDTDGDGIFDFRVDEFNGRFYEGDMDIDGDGISNSFDLSPYKKGSQSIDTDRDSIPDHIDWNQMGKSKKMAEYQKQLWSRFGVLMVERSSPFTEQLAETIFDIFTRVYVSLFENSRKMPTLHVISSDDVDGLAKGKDPDGKPLFYKTFGLAGPSNRSLVIFDRGIGLPPFLQFGLLAHELKHHHQYSMDFHPTQHNYLDNRYECPKFHQEAESFGWTIKAVSGNGTFSLFAPQFKEGTEKKYEFGGRTTEEWQEYIKARGEKKYLKTPEARKLNIIGKYSLSSPWEWDADHFIAYLFMGMERTAEKIDLPFPKGELQAIFAQAREQNIETWKFYHGNMRPELFKTYSRRYPISPENWEFLTRKYLLKIRSK